MSLVYALHSELTYIKTNPRLQHQAGHLCALARVAPTSFILLGADACHHVGVLRPTAHLHKHFPCPGALISATRASVSHVHFPASSESGSDSAFDLTARTKPFLTVAHNGYFEDVPAAEASVGKLSELFDASSDVLVVLAHDESIPSVMGKLPQTLDDWKERDLKRKSVWSFLDEKNPAFRFGAKA
uniref:Uncharacterized protein n=1 Tax=Mycena chlorophos TaxID=658473 RepID=A0ABQ0L1C3_MYCCL|nr:predicted protein [Mycena chlorophos]